MLWTWKAWTGSTTWLFFRGKLVSWLLTLQGGTRPDVPVRWVTSFLPPFCNKTGQVWRRPGFWVFFAYLLCLLLCARPDRFDRADAYIVGHSGKGVACFASAAGLLEVVLSLRYKVGSVPLSQAAVAKSRQNRGPIFLIYSYSIRLLKST